MKIVEESVVAILFGYIGFVKAAKVAFKDILDTPLLLVQRYPLLEEVKGVKLAMKIFTTITMHLDLPIQRYYLF